MRKYIYKARKSSSGNITIMVLVIGLIIIFAITMLTKFMFEDIIFTKLSESKLKALNIAEAGIANMFSNIEKYYNDEISSLPSSPYSEEVLNSDGDVIGSFIVEYDEVYDDEGKLTNYIITSEGTDTASGQSRKVKVNLAVSFSTEVDIFCYIYSRDGLEFFDLINDLVIRDLIQLGDVISGDKILVGGNIDMSGYSRIRSKMINVGGDIEMSSSLGPRIESNSSSETLTMIVMGDIRIKDNSRIGSSSNPVDLSCHGDIITSGSARVYYNEPIGDDLFDPPKLNVQVYINSFINQIQEPPSDVLIVGEDEDGTADGVFIIDPDLIDYQPPDDIFFRESSDNLIKFYEDSGSYFLEVKGNVLVNGDIKIGEDIESEDYDPPDNDIYYSGKGKLIATGNIDASCGLVPADPVSEFPENKLLILMSTGDLNISVEDYNNYVGDYEDPDVYILGMAGESVILSSHNAVLGSLIANQITAVDESGLIGFLLGSLATIGYEEDLGNNIPDDLPKLVYGGVTFSKQWEEVVY